MSIDGNGYVTHCFAYLARIIVRCGGAARIESVVKIMNREKRAAAYRAKSDESLAAAKICVDKQLYRAACNRAWYATMQIITAGAYQELSVKPVGEKLSYSHSAQHRIFGDLIEEARRLDHSYLRAWIREAKDLRDVADYGLEAERLELKDAKRSINTAEEVRKVVIDIVGPAWQ